VHEPAQPGRERRGDYEADGERARGEPALPAELVENGREEERERGSRVDPDGHGDEGGGHHHPAVEERKPHGRGSASDRRSRRGASRGRGSGRGYSACGRPPRTPPPAPRRLS